MATKKSKATHGKRLKAAKKIEEQKPLTTFSGISITKGTDGASPK
ncbi:MAG TPA: hypothetical protein VEJ38_02955 [Candidatus Acidoferrales bacterium]|nr:hypothetical protein [Candidatus Acidoferrales bacterium]